MIVPDVIVQVRPSFALPAAKVAREMPLTSALVLLMPLQRVVAIVAAPAVRARETAFLARSVLIIFFGGFAFRWVF